MKLSESPSEKNQAKSHNMNKSVYLERENLKLQKNYSIISKKKAISLRNRFKTDKNINININHNININKKNN